MAKERENVSINNVTARRQRRIWRRSNLALSLERRKQASRKTKTESKTVTKGSQFTQVVPTTVFSDVFHVRFQVASHFRLSEC